MILEVKNIQKSFGAVQVVKDVSFVLKSGDSLAIVGESGCGKSTLAKIIVGLMKPDHGKVISQTKIQMVFQDPYSSLDPMYTIRSILNEALTGQPARSKAQRDILMGEMLAQVGLESNMLTRFPHEFSGGQRQRIAIARALLAQPQLLILDEPTSALDVLVQKQICDLLLLLKSRLNLTTIFISHNLRVVRGFSDKICVMYQGSIVEEGLAQDVLTHPYHPYTQGLVKAAFQYST